MDKYYVTKGNIGYVICEQSRSLPLPFMWSTSYAACIACEEFNKGGYRVVAEYYYVHKVAGTRDIKPILAAGKNPYEEWMAKNGDMFKRE